MKKLIFLITIVIMATSCSISKVYHYNTDNLGKTSVHFTSKYQFNKAVKRYEKKGVRIIYNESRLSIELGVDFINETYKHFIGKVKLILRKIN